MNVAPRVVADIYDKFMDGDWKGALEAQYRLAPLRIIHNDRHGGAVGNRLIVGIQLILSLADEHRRQNADGIISTDRCSGAVASCANVAPRVVADIYDKFMDGDWKGALEAQYRLAPLRIACGFSSRQSWPATG